MNQPFSSAEATAGGAKKWCSGTSPDQLESSAETKMLLLSAEYK